METSVSRRCLQRKTAQVLKRSQSTTTLQVCRIGIPPTMDPTLRYKMTVVKPVMDLVRGLQPRYTHTETRRDHGKTREQKQTVVNVDREHRDGWMFMLSETSEWWTSLGTSHDERMLQSNARARCKARANATRHFVNWLTPKLAITFRAQGCAMMTEKADACFSEPRLCWYREFV